MIAPRGFREALQRHKQERADAALIRFLQAREEGVPPYKLQLLREAYDRAWLAASYVRPSNG